MNISCIKCKGADPQKNCGRSFCPLVAKSQSMFKVKKSLNSSEFSSASPTPFVGRFGYPEVNLGLLAPPEYSSDIWMHDAPKFWSKKNFSIKDIIGFRSNLINSNSKKNIKLNDSFVDIAQEVAMASRPVDLDFSLIDKPRFRLNQDSFLAPTGPLAQLKKARITSNPKIHTKVDKVNSDTDLTAKNALRYLYNSGFDENFLSRILSVGTVGIKNNRKLVPTRWSITATDDMIGKDLLENVQTYEFSDFLVFFGDYLGNYYLIILLPGNWSYELFESYLPNVSWNTTNQLQFSTDYEPFSGRTKYAENCAGGYYTVRLAALEYLDKVKKQAQVLAIRIITGEYASPLGVWVTREAARKSLTQKPLNFASKDLALSYAREFLNKKFGTGFNSIFANSIILSEFQKQRLLTDYI